MNGRQASLRGRPLVAAALALLLVAAGCSVRVQRTPSGEAATTELTVVVVRHAERADDSSDPPLSEAGSRRAEALASALADAGVVAIYTTQYRRTVDTAAPLARRTGVQAQVISAGSGAAHAAEVAARVRQHAEGTVLVVGHSNTVPAIIRELGGPVVTVADADYGQLFVLQLTPAGVRLIRGSF